MLLDQKQVRYILILDFSLLREKDCLLVAVKGVQKGFLHNLQSTGSLALIHPSKLYQEAIRLGLSPLFTDAPNDISISEVSIAFRNMYI